MLPKILILVLMLSAGVEGRASAGHVVTDVRDPPLKPSASVATIRDRCIAALRLAGAGHEAAGACSCIASFHEAYLDAHLLAALAESYDSSLPVTASRDVSPKEASMLMAWDVEVAAACLLDPSLRPEEGREMRAVSGGMPPSNR